MKKKTGLMLGAVVLLGIFALSFVSAQYFGGFYYDVRYGMESLINIVVDFFQPLLQVLLGNETGGYTGYLLFEKLILFLILASIVYLAISKIPPFKGNSSVTWIITLAIPLLAIRFMDFDWLNAILIQYQILGVALTSILPFVIYFLFLETIDYGTIRKIGWIFFIIVYFGLWSTASSQMYMQFYMWTIVASVIFLLLDGTIHRWYMLEKIKASGKTNVEQAAEAVRRKMWKAKEDLDHNIITRDVYDDRIEELEKDLRSIYRHSF